MKYLREIIENKKTKRYFTTIEIACMQMQLFTFKLDMCIYESFILFGRYVKEMEYLH